MFTLSGNNSYTGGTIIDGGTLQLQSALAHLGSGNVSITSNAITLEITTGVLDAIGNAATLSIAGGGTINIADAGFVTLGLGVNEIVGGLVLGGVAQSPGTYGSSSSPVLFKNLAHTGGSDWMAIADQTASSVHWNFEIDFPADFFIADLG